MFTISNEKLSEYLSSLVVEDMVHTTNRINNSGTEQQIGHLVSQGYTYEKIWQKILSKHLNRGVNVIVSEDNTTQYEAVVLSIADKFITVMDQNGFQWEVLRKHIVHCK